MLYVHIIARLNGKPVEARIADESERCQLTTENRNDWKSFEAAEAIAKALGEGYIAVDAGAHVSPRYDVIELPKVGDDVSYGFNGDYYPCGKIIYISRGPNYRKIVTDDGSVFWRLRKTGSWKKDQTWSLVQGVINKRNPEF